LVVMCPGRESSYNCQNELGFVNITIKTFGNIYISQMNQTILRSLFMI